VEIEEAIAHCKNTNLFGWELVEYVQKFIHVRMAYSYNNSFDMPYIALKKGKGYCWQQAVVLQKILNYLNFKCNLVYSIKNYIPEKQYEGITIKEHESGHVWCKVIIDGIEKDVCPGNINNKPGKIHFTPLSPVKKWNSFIGFWSYWGSAFVNYRRLKSIKKD
jgi:hypothetical protein